jgi:hypothetical protein
MSRRDRLGPLGLAALVVALLLGVGLGIAAERWVLRPIRRDGWVHRHDGRIESGRYRTELSDRLARELDLAPDQRARVDSLLVRQQEATRAIIREVRPRLQQVTERTRDSLRLILTPDQLDRWERMDRARRPQRR